MKAPRSDVPKVRENRRTRVLEQAAKTLNNGGVSQNALGEIAEALGLTRPALYYYFKDQEDLVFQSYRRSCEILARQFETARRSGGDSLGVIEAFLDGMLGEAESASLSDVAYLRPEQRRIIGVLYQSILENVSDLLKLGAQRGELRDCSTEIVPHVVVGLVSAVALGKRQWHSVRVTHGDLTAAFKDIIRRGVAADRRAPLQYQAFELTGPQFAVGRVFDAEALAEAKHQALIAAASWLFSQKGIDATTLDEVALRVGVTKKVIYHNVGDKDTLVAECYRRSFRFFDDLADRTRTYRGSRIEALCASWHGLTEASLREDIAPMPPAPGFEAWPESVSGWIRQEATRLQDNYAALYEAAAADDSGRAINARAAVVLQTRLFRWLPKWIEPVGPAARAAHAREITDFLRLGLAPL